MTSMSENSNVSYNQNNPPQVYKIKQYRAPSYLEEISYMLIRPPRFLYNEELLAPPPKYQQLYTIEEYLIPFKLSLYRVENMRYIILYLHGNSSSRFEGYLHLKYLPRGVGLACFDFNGCGMRFDAQFITLGKEQSIEVDIAAKFLKKFGLPVVGWGRSMGSVSLLLSEECDVMVADSPFCSLSQLCRQASEKIFPKYFSCLVSCMYSCIFNKIRDDVLQKSGMDPDKLEIATLVAQNPINRSRKLYIMAGKHDSMISFQHSSKIYNEFPGKKCLNIFDGTHNSDRPTQVIKQCFRFVQQSLGLQPLPDLPQTHKKHPRKIILRPVYRQPQGGSKPDCDEQSQNNFLQEKKEETCQNVLIQVEPTQIRSSPESSQLTGKQTMVSSVKMGDSKHEVALNPIEEQQEMSSNRYHNQTGGMEGKVKIMQKLSRKNSHNEQTEDAELSATLMRVVGSSEIQPSKTQEFDMQI